MGQLATLVANCALGNFPSTTKVNLKENYKAITLISGENYEGPSEKQPVEEEGQDQQERVQMDKKHRKEKFTEFLKVFKKLHIDIPFEEALEKMPSYVKFKKDIMSKKRKIKDFETVALIEDCSAILQKKLPPKLRDPGSFTIPCTVGKIEGINDLCDLGARINLMPLSVLKRLKLGEAKPIMVTL
uniref:Aspartic peptidase DDI1-type domain-containing protein n=1 Tax=Cannabis sativa TaxID=3483 RepID=A0A803Q8W6_CANSA